MRIDYLSRSNIAPLATDTALMIRRHRDNARHRRIIESYRASHPLCERCLAEGRTSATQEVHHVQPVAAGGQTVNSNLLALCLPCHHTINDIPHNQQHSFKERA